MTRVTAFGVVAMLGFGIYAAASSYRLAARVEGVEAKVERVEQMVAVFTGFRAQVMERLDQLGRCACPEQMSPVGPTP